MKTLVVGCDASGKSSFLEGVHRTWGDSYGESTSSETARAFRQANNDRLIDSEYIDLREKLYLELSHKALIATSQVNKNIVTTDSSLVTRVSHSVMRQIINEPYLSNEDVISSWQEDEVRAGANAPDAIVFIHAPFSIIRSRIITRQEAGNKLEHFWGFNSPFFLNAYQERWKTLIGDLENKSYTCLALNSDTTSLEDEINQYALIRR